MSQELVITHTGITDEAEAIAALAAEGLTGYPSDVTGQVEELHWHEFDTIVYVLSGEAAAEYPDGTVRRGGAGTKAFLPAGCVHKDVPGTSYRAVFAFSVDPAAMTQPINKPVR